MLKKILLVTIGIAGLGFMIFGAVNRTLALSDKDSVTGDNRRGYTDGAVLETQGERQYLNQKDNRANTDEIVMEDDLDQSRQYLNAKDNISPNEGSGKGRPSGTEEALHSSSFEGSLSQEEISALQYMREEEKLARDVYTTLYSLWGQNIFLNISQSEQAHMDAIKTLLDGYGLVDPASSKVGDFTNPELQTLYTELIARGSQSLVEAINVGAAIEEIDILDLEKNLQNTTNQDVQRVFDSLMKGSVNHLNAFAKQYIRQTGVSYTPQFMAQEEYDTLVSSQSGNGSKGGGYRGGKNT